MNKFRHLLRIWNEVTTDNPSRDTEWHRATVVHIYNNSYPNDPADEADLDEALDRATN